VAEPEAGARVDAWLWSVRVTPSRSVATSLCKAGHVTINGRSAKAASVVHVGDRVVARGRDLEVRVPIQQRVGAPIAATCFVDHTPVREPGEEAVAVRDRGTGRPTKRERRTIDRWRGR
jgi:ribosome-associated heat shock protein Hsp15